MNTVTAPTTTNSGAASAVPDLGILQAQIAQTREALKRQEAEFEAQRIAAEEKARQEQAAKEQARLEELKALPAKFGFENMRAFVGFLGYNFLRGQRRAKVKNAKAAKVAKSGNTRQFKGRKRLNDVERAHLIEELKNIPQSGKGIPEIAAKYGCSRQNVYLIAKTHKIPLPSQLAA